MAMIKNRLTGVSRVTARIILNRLLQIFIGFCLILFQTSCTKHRAELGTEDNPIKFYLVPSVDARLLESEGKKLKTYLELQTPYKFKISVPTSYIAVVEAFGAQRADVSAMNTFGYLLANERYGTEARLTLIRYGENSYRSMIIVRNDSPIQKVEQLNGKRFAYVDPASGSGYIVPAKFFKDRNIKFKETVFSQKHDNSVMMVYQRQVDAAAAFYSPPQEGRLEDARRLVLKQYPNVEKEIRILALTEPVPNDPIIFRKNLPEEVKIKIIEAILLYIQSKEGKDFFYSIYGANSFEKSTDRTYDGFRKILKDMGVSTSGLVK